MRADRLTLMLLMVACLCGLSGCASPRSMEPRESRPPAPREAYPPPQKNVETAPPYAEPSVPAAPPVKQVSPAPKPASQPSARQVASLRLTETGKALLDQGKPDEAIAMLERAVSMNTTNGQNYYYLAECWLLKSNAGQAREYNRLATLYFQGNGQWLDRCADQAELIRKIER